MSTSTIAYDARPTTILARVGAYVELTKPKIAALELVTVVVAATVASSGVPRNVWLLVHVVVGTALVAASASVLNQVLERGSDLRMPRTATRPLPTGQVSAWEAFLFGFLTVVLGTIYLGVLVNWTTATIGALTWFLYVCVYTPLKSRTSANTLVGAVAGAGPVLMGWTAVQPSFGTRESAMLATTLFLIVFLWQFPHFMAIAWIYRRDYALAGSRMLTVVEPSGRLAGVQAVTAAVMLLPVSLLPAMIMRAGPLYFFLALTLSLAQLAVAVGFLMRRDDTAARRMLRMSLVYLPVLLGLLMLSPFVFPWL